jgi:acetylglutamate kinase
MFFWRMTVSIDTSKGIAGLKGALRYVRAYRDHVFVVKLGGDVLKEPEVLDSVAGQLALLSSLGIRLVVVHGGGPQATALSRRLGQEPRMVAGRRVTDDDALEVAKMVYAGQINVDLLAALREHRVQAVGLSGVDAELITAHRRPPVSVVEDSGKTVKVDYGHVGDIDRVDPRVLTALMDARMVPVVASLAGGENSEVYNVNGDTVAEALAVALRAHKLIFLTGAPGVLRDSNDPSTLVTFADPDDLAGLMANGALSGGMRPKVEACIRAATGGVERTHIIDGRAPDALLLEVFTGSGCGTMIVGRKEKATYLGVDLAG